MKNISKQNMLNILIKAIPDLVWLKDNDGVYLACNTMFENYLGLNEKDIVGKTDYDFLDKQVADRFREHEKILISKNQVIITENKVTFSSDGHQAYLETIKTPLNDAQGNVTGILCVARDISKRKENEDTLLKLSIAVEQSPCSIVITDLDSKIEYVNQAFLQSTGYSLGEVLGKTPKILNSGKTPKSKIRKLWQTILKKNTWEGELINKRKDGSEYISLTSITPIRKENNQISHYLAIKQDITERKAIEEENQYLAFNDPLTGLWNRRKLLDQLDITVMRCQRENTKMALLMIDLDKFKSVNDTLGHLSGDDLLKQVAKNIASNLRKSDIVARLGGDEFIILLDNITHQDDAARIATKIITDLSQPFTLKNNNKVYIGSSIGIAIYPEHGTTPNILIDHADMALYQAKDSGRGCFSYFSESLTLEARERLDLENRLRHGIEQGELRVFYQAQADMLTDKIVSAEALVRWQTSDGKLISPDKFIAIAEESGLILHLGEWVIREVCRQGREWLDAGFEPIRLAVNVSPKQFKHCNMLELISSVLHETKYPAEYLEIELTESGLMENQELVVSVLSQLRELGIHLAIDDFGTGYSSLAYLKRFPMNVLKIDKSFIDDIPHSNDDMAIASAIISMGQTLGFKVLAEGVETIEQLDFLQKKGCNTYQGYIKSKPVPSNEFIRFLR